MGSVQIDHLKMLEYENVVAYLTASGWTEKATKDYASVWVSGDSEVFIPAKQARDFYPRMREAIAEISSISKQSEESVFRRILLSGFELLKVSAVGPGSNNGTVSFEDGGKLLSNVRELLLAAASAVIVPRRVYLGKRPERASTFLDEARLGQTEHGSFVLTVLAPRMQGDDASLPGIQEDLPFGVRALKTLISASKSAKQAAEMSYSDSEWFDRNFVPLVEKGVSANLCSAISNMLELGGAEKVVLSMTPSSSAMPPQETVEFPVGLNERLAQAAAEFRKDPPLENVDIQGTAISFRRDSANKIGKVSLKGKVGGEKRRVSFSLPTEQYNVFLEAHKHDHPISLRADLRKNGTSYEATNIRDLRSLSVKDLFDEIE